VENLWQLYAAREWAMENDIQGLSDRIFQLLERVKPPVVETGWVDLSGHLEEFKRGAEGQNYREARERIRALQDPRYEVQGDNARRRREDAPWPIEMHSSTHMKVLLAIHAHHLRGFTWVSSEQICRHGCYQENTVYATLGRIREYLWAERDENSRGHRLLIDPDRQLWVQAGRGKYRLITLREELVRLEEMHTLSVASPEAEATCQALGSLEGARRVHREAIAFHQKCLVELDAEEGRLKGE
jgi:hypothetical protein